MNITQILGIGIIGAILAITVKNTRPELGVCVSLAVGCVIFCLVLPHFKDAVNEIEEITQEAGVEFTYFPILVKIIGIACISQFSAEIIKDAGENAIAKKVAFAGKVAILIMILPIIKELISVIFRTLSIL